MARRGRGCYGSVVARRKSADHRAGSKGGWAPLYSPPRWRIRGRLGLAPSETRLQDENAFAGFAHVEFPECLNGLVEVESMRDQPVQRHVAINDESSALFQSDTAEGPG